MRASTFHVGMKVRTGGVTFFVIQAASAPEAGAEAMRRAISRGYDVTEVLCCSEQRGGPHMLTAPFLAAA